jgi:hypothetical protein
MLYVGSISSVEVISISVSCLSISISGQIPELLDIHSEGYSVCLWVRWSIVLVILVLLVVVVQQ